MEQIKTCCFMGPSFNSLFFGFSEDDERSMLFKQSITDDILELILNYNVIHFISGMSLGIGIYVAEIILILKDTYSEITLECVQPYETQAINWSIEQQERYYNILEKSDQVVMLQKKYTNICMQMRNEYMIDNSGYVLIIWNGKYYGINKILNYAESKEKNIILINSTSFFQNEKKINIDMI